MFLLSIMIASCLASCWDERNFYINDINVFIDIERMGNDTFRVFIYKDSIKRGEDYIDIVYDMSDMPSILLCFPTETDDSVYVIDNYREVDNIEASNYQFICLTKDPAPNGEIPTQEQMDRVNRHIQLSDSIRANSVTIQLNSRLTDLAVWNKNKSLRIVHNHDWHE